MTGGTRGFRGQIVDDRFELLERLGAGGMGTVWRARDTALHREVALKEVRPPEAELAAAEDGEGESEGSRALRERVLREARALARLSHPHVVTIHHIVDRGPYPWIVMELVPGRSLQEKLDEGPLEPAEVARIGREVLGALRTSHAAGIQHRDVKPANVLLRTDGSAVLTDFGIAALQGSATVTATGEFLGSPEYIAPERIRGIDDDPASDLWSLGMTLYVCAEGHNPMRRTSSLSTLAAVLDAPIPPPVRSGPLTPVLTALLARDSAARPAADELDRMLADVAEGRAATPYLPTQGPMPTMPGADPGPPRPPGPPGPPGPPTPPPHTAQPGSTPHTPHTAHTAHTPQQGFGPVPGGYPSDAGSGSAGAGSAGIGPGRTDPAGTGRTGGRRKGRIALAVGAAVLAAGLIAGGTYALTSSDSTADNRADGRGTHAPATSSEPEPDPDPSENGGERPTDNPSEADSPSAGPSRTQDERQDRPSDGPSERDTDPPQRAGGPADSWVAQLGSVAKSDGAAARDKMHAALRAKTGGVQYVDSDRFASLRSGYWMFYRAGPSAGFADGHAAASWCARSGLASSNQCVGRYLSDNSADRVYICAPDKSRGTGRCER